MALKAESQRLEEHNQLKGNWKKWGPYLSERAWGTVREDYSPEGNAWSYFSHEHARSRAYRWNEDGLMGFSDRNQYLCFSVALWNEHDPILKERLFGLAGGEGNHGEDVKEYYYYLDSTPTHSYVKMLYKYPQAEFPYAKLVEQNKNRNFSQMEYELIDTGIFNDNRYFDVYVEYAKADQEDILIRITAYNRGPETASLHLLPTLWNRNTWSWGYEKGPMGDVADKPKLKLLNNDRVEIHGEHSAAGEYWFYGEEAGEVLFTENETNLEVVTGQPNPELYTKDAFHRYIIHRQTDAVNPEHAGTKAAIHYEAQIPAGGKKEWHLRLSNRKQQNPFAGFDAVFKQRISESDEFYKDLQTVDLDSDMREIQRQAFAGLLCSKQLYYFDVEQWVKGDDNSQNKRTPVRNKEWDHLVNFDIISMPDKWEYPWYASWDLAFHCISLVLVDSDFAKRQLTLMTREWYMHPNGQLPAYEWNFGDVNPPVLAWATWRVYKIDAKETGKRDRAFLQGIFNKLLLNFTWWVNRKDAEGRNIFQGGFLGLDNISIFDRSQPMPNGGHLDQADGTAWMGFYCIVMMKIALELARDNPVWQDTATKFFEHFLRIAGAIKNLSDGAGGLWDEEDGFFYDTLHIGGKIIPIKVRSLVGLLPLLPVETLDSELLRSMPIFSRRTDWFMSKRPDLADSMACMYTPGMGERRMMSFVTKERLVKILHYMLDENEFLSPYGIRSLSKYHEQHPYDFQCEGMKYEISYQPAESLSGLFGGNSNWRGPVWFPINYLLIESLQKYHHYYGDELKVEFPTHSGNYMSLWEVAEELSKRLINLFTVNEKGERPFFGGQQLFQHDPYWKDNLFFHEYFHGDNGAGIGASHQTGWTALVAKLIQQSGNK